MALRGAKGSSQKGDGCTCNSNCVVLGQAGGLRGSTDDEEQHRGPGGPCAQLTKQLDGHELVSETAGPRVQVGGWGRGTARLYWR